MEEIPKPKSPTFLFNVIDDPFRKTYLEVWYDRHSENIIFRKYSETQFQDFDVPQKEFWIKKVQMVIACQKYPNPHPEYSELYSEGLTRIFERALREIALFYRKEKDKKDDKWVE